MEGSAFEYPTRFSMALGAASENLQSYELYIVPSLTNFADLSIAMVKESDELFS